jgi:hypothetical protein
LVVAVPLVTTTALGLVEVTPYLAPLLLPVEAEAVLVVVALVKPVALAAEQRQVQRDMRETLQAQPHLKAITAAMALQTLRPMRQVVAAVRQRLEVTAIMAPQLAALEEMEPHRQLAAAA